MANPRALIVDAGPLYAIADVSDRNHRECLELLSSHPGPLIVPTLVISEVGYLVGHRLGARAEVLFAQDLALGTLLVDAVHPGDWVRIAELVARYRDFALGMVDASVVVCAERHGVSEVATLDRRHFSAVRPSHVPALTLLPG